MDSILLTILLGIVQALTEFLPVSSSGHLILFRFFTGFSVPETLAFDVALHAGSAVALLVYFRKECFDLITKYRSHQTRLLLYAVLTTAVVGFVVEPWLSSVRQPFVIALMLILGGLLLLWVEQRKGVSKTVEQLKPVQAMGIGFIQAFAFIPGVSRSGVTIIAGMWNGLKRQEAAVFSFLMGIPLLLLAGGKKGWDIWMLQEVIPWDLFFVGFLTSAVCSFVVIHVFLRLIHRYSLAMFGWYRILLGVFVLIWMLLS